MASAELDSQFTPEEKTALTALKEKYARQEALGEHKPYSLKLLEFAKKRAELNGETSRRVIPRSQPPAQQLPNPENKQ